MAFENPARDSGWCWGNLALFDTSSFEASLTIKRLRTEDGRDRELGQHSTCSLESEI
jgi:hypothetical protein